MKHRFIMLVGLPGTGKSTYCARHKESEIISLDRLIENTMTPDETYAQAFLRVRDTGALKKMDKEMFAFAEALGKLPTIIGDLTQMVVIWDQTNLTVKSRKRKLELFPAKDWRRECVVFNLTEEEWNRRLNKREEETGKTIPSYVLKEMRTSFQMPDCDEGFDGVTYLEA